MMLAAIITVYPWVCDANWWRGKQLERAGWWNAPHGLSYHDNECRLAVGWAQMLFDERLDVRREACGLCSEKTRTCRVVGPKVGIRAWRLTQTAWVFEVTEILCGPAHRQDLRVNDWCVSSNPRGCR